MEFRTEIDIPASALSFGHNDKIMLLGSCFSDNVGARLRDAWFDVMVNPFGVSYNPESIARQLEILISGRKITPEELFFHDDRWHCFDFHSSFSMASQSDTLDAMNRSLDAARNHLSHCSTVVVTLGTAWVYREKESQKVVANCHKLPASRFERTIMQPEEVVEALRRIRSLISASAPEAGVVFTVSPIRHIADTLAGNMLSKSLLRVAADIVAAESRTEYFPSYEIMLDDLRDYRFYNSDMVHPSDVAIDYIYDKFLTSHCDATAISAGERCRKFSLLLQHRPMTDSDALLQRHNASIVKKADDLAASYPYLAARLSAITKKYSQ